MKNLSKETLAIVKQMQQSELTESVIYEKIAKFAKGEENKKTLRRLFWFILCSVKKHAKICTYREKLHKGRIILCGS